ncbi:MAG: type VI secretion system-associated protein TagF [Burkholderiales bacterium]|nr:MAG: type VI secretion system-associated protein TagF [Burkholderiales bacterium]
MDQTHPEPVGEAAGAACEARPESITPGWYGKLPAAGDFLSRRVPASFVAGWDAWLSRGIVHGREALGEAWPEAFMTFPPWRFALSPGVVDAQAWVGLLLPSVDRVGRQFPLTVARPVGSDALAELVPLALDAFLAQVESAALRVLQDDDVDGFERDLAALGMVEEGNCAGRLPLAEAGPDMQPAHSALDGTLQELLARSAWATLFAGTGQVALFWIAADAQEHAGLAHLERGELRTELLAELVTAAPPARDRREP